MRIVSDTRKVSEYLSMAGLTGVERDHPASLYFCPAGEYIVRQGDPIRNLYIFAEGRAKIIRLMENGRTMLHAFTNGVSLLGDLEMGLGDATVRTDVRAITDAWMVGILLDGRQEAVLRDPRLSRFIVAELAKKLEASSRSAAENLLYPLSDRLEAYMREEQTNGLFSESLTHTAELLGVSYRHLLRVLSAFEREGRIRKTRGGYELVNP